MKKIKLLVAAFVLMAASVFFLTNEANAEVSKDAVIKEGVYIGGIDVSGMTAEQATAAVDTYVAKLQEYWIVLQGAKNTLRYQWKDLGLSAKTSVAVQEAVSVGNSGNLIKRFKALQELEKEDYVVDMGLGIDKQLAGNKIHSKRSKIDIKAIDNGLRKENGQFVYTPGQDGNEVDIVTSVNALDAHVGSDWELAPIEDAKFALTSVVSHPRGTEEQLSVVKDLIGTFTTNYKSSGSGRAKNVENGTDKISGAILYPGDEFSVYEAVNPFTKENGYELAGSYSNGETVESFGGGICQVSTTLYNAILNAELEITQRFNHSMIVTYVDPAADAAIAGTYKDLRFRNNYDFPVYIEGVYKNRNITFNIYGVETRDANRKVTYESEIIKENDPPTEFTLSSSRELGSFIQTRSKHVGYVAKYWKIVTVDGVEQERTQVNKSTYNASCRKVTIGTKGATAEQLAAIKAAIATKDDAHVKAVVEGFKKPATTKPTPTPTPGATTPNEGTTPGTGNTTPEATTPNEGTTPGTGNTTPETPDSGNGNEENPSTPGEGEGSDGEGDETPETGEDTGTVEGAGTDSNE
ncbi:MAG: VanW family protein [Agathobacter sp.]|nr:VanW family protein [Agathobacter sp.]